MSGIETKLEQLEKQRVQRAHSASSTSPKVETPDCQQIEDLGRFLKQNASTLQGLKTEIIPRIQTLWFEYAKMVQDPETVYEFMMENNIAKQDPSLYSNWAFILEKYRRKFEAASQVFLSGLKHVEAKSTNETMLEQKYKEFANRMHIRHERDVKDVLGNQYLSPNQSETSSKQSRKRKFEDVFGESEITSQQNPNNLSHKRVLLSSKEIENCYFSVHKYLDGIAKVRQLNKDDEIEQLPYQNEVDQMMKRPLSFISQDRQAFQDERCEIQSLGVITERSLDAENNTSLMNSIAKFSLQTGSAPQGDHHEVIENDQKPEDKISDYVQIQKQQNSKIVQDQKEDNQRLEQANNNKDLSGDSPIVQDESVDQTQLKLAEEMVLQMLNNSKNDQSTNNQISNLAKMLIQQVKKDLQSEISLISQKSQAGSKSNNANNLMPIYSPSESSVMNPNTHQKAHVPPFQNSESQNNKPQVVDQQPNLFDKTKSELKQNQYLFRTSELLSVIKEKKSGNPILDKENKINEKNQNEEMGRRKSELFCKLMKQQDSGMTNKKIQPTVVNHLPAFNQKQDKMNMMDEQSDVSSIYPGQSIFKAMINPDYSYMDFKKRSISNAAHLQVSEYQARISDQMLQQPNQITTPTKSGNNVFRNMTPLRHSQSFTPKENFDIINDNTFSVALPQFQQQKSMQPPNIPSILKQQSQTNMNMPVYNGQVSNQATIFEDCKYFTANISPSPIKGGDNKNTVTNSDGGFFSIFNYITGANQEPSIDIVSRQNQQPQLAEKSNSKLCVYNRFTGEQTAALGAAISNTTIANNGNKSALQSKTNSSKSVRFANK